LDMIKNELDMTKKQYKKFRHFWTGMETDFGHDRFWTRLKKKGSSDIKIL